MIVWLKNFFVRLGGFVEIDSYGITYCDYDNSFTIHKGDVELKLTQELKSITINDKVEFSTYSNNTIIVTLFGGNEYKLTEDDMYIVKFMEEE